MMRVGIQEQVFELRLKRDEVLFTLRDYSGFMLIEKVEKAIDVLEGMGATPVKGRSGGRKGKSQ